MRSSASGRASNRSMTSSKKHGNPVWAGVEANAGIPGLFVDWETYIGWHYNHGCILPVYLRKLCWNLRLEPISYLTALKKFCEQNGLHSDAGWFERAIKTLTE